MSIGRGIGFTSIPATFLVFAFLAISSIASAQSESIIGVGKFSMAEPGALMPAGWKPLAFKRIERHTLYALVKDNGTVVVKAMAEASASGLMREIKINPKEYPIVQWRWKVSNILKKGNVYRKDGDDYPARVYITFAYDPSRLSLSERLKYKAVRLLYGEYPPLAAINYIWESHAPVGTMVPNPFTNRIMMFVAERVRKSSTNGSTRKATSMKIISEPSGKSRR